MKKSYVISVSLGTGCYRHIRISAGATLFQLHKAILNAFDFKDDHLHAFFMDNRCWSPNDAYFSSEMGIQGNYGLTKRTTLAKLNLSPNDKFKYLFDFGDDWVFQCKVLREMEGHVDIPCILRSVGENPKQYPSYEDENEPLTREELDELYAQLPLDMEAIKCIHRYFEAASRLYGLISLREIEAIYNSQNPPVSEDLFYHVAQLLEFENNDYNIIVVNGVSDGNAENGVFVAADYLLYDGTTTDFLNLNNEQGEKPRNILPKKDFLRYAEDGYYPDTPQKRAMLKYLNRRKATLSMPPQEFCATMQDMISAGGGLKDILGIVQQEGLTFDRKWSIEEFATLFVDLHNHTPMHSNKGYTPTELWAMPQENKSILSNDQFSLFE